MISTINFETKKTNENLTDLSNNLLIPNGANEFIKTVLNNETSLNIEDQEFKTVNTVKERLDRLSANNLILGSSLDQYMLLNF